MSTQISLQLPDELAKKARKHVKEHGFANLQEFIREAVRKELYDDELMTGHETMLASRKSLAKLWLTPEEDKAWAHFQKKK